MTAKQAFKCLGTFVPGVISISRACLRNKLNTLYEVAKETAKQTSGLSR